MNEKKKGLVVLGILGAIIVAIAIAIIIDKQNTKAMIANYYSLYNQDEYAIVFFGKTDCDYCKNYTPELERVMTKYDLTYTYINIDKLSDDELLAMLNKANVSSSDFGTPTTVVISNGEVIASHIGSMDSEAIVSFLIEAAVLPSDTVMYPNISYITYDEYVNLMNGDQTSMVVIGQTGCSHCASAKPAYDDIATKYQVAIYYLNYTNLSTDEKTALATSNTYFKTTESWGTPLLLGVKDGDVVAHVEGYQDEVSLEASLLNEGLISHE